MFICKPELLSNYSSIRYSVICSRQRCIYSYITPFTFAFYVFQGRFSCLIFFAIAYWTREMFNKSYWSAFLVVAANNPSMYLLYCTASWFDGARSDNMKLVLRVLESHKKDCVRKVPDFQKSNACSMLGINAPCSEQSGELIVEDIDGFWVRRRDSFRRIYDVNETKISEFYYLH